MAASLPPSFPKGLRVLLVDDDHSRPAVEAQLRQPELQYSVTACGSSTEALGFCRAAARSVDVVLAESKLVAPDEGLGKAFIDAFEDVPVVLMSEGGATDEVMRAVTLGAVDFLDKPLSLLKLKNIWQHSVRRMMQRTSLYDAGYSMPAAPAYSEPAPMMTHQQPSMSNCLPSSMTAPIHVMVPPPRKSTESKPTGTTMTPAVAHRSSIDSPGTPSAGDAEPAESLCAGSVHQLKGETTTANNNNNAATTTTMDDSLTDCSDITGIDAESKLAGDARSKSTSAVPCVVGQWPQLPVGCVWGTPVGGTILPPPANHSTTAAAAANTTNVSSMTAPPALAPPPAVPTMTTSSSLLGSANAPVLLKSRPANSASEVSLPSLCASHVNDAPLAPSPLTIPEGFLSLKKAKEEATRGAGPIGLKLRKSNSLLDLLNSTLKPQNAGMAQLTASAQPCSV